jgi:bacterioferritin-associated ferredoxin
MIVCVCHRVSDRDIAHAVREGCDSFDELQDHLRVATGCGACDDCARQTFDAHRGAQAPCAMVAPWGGRRQIRLEVSVA